MRWTNRKDGTRRTTVTIFLHIAEPAVDFIVDGGKYNRSDAVEWLALYGPGASLDERLVRDDEGEPFFHDRGDDSDDFFEYSGPEPVITSRTRTGTAKRQREMLARRARPSGLAAREG